MQGKQDLKKKEIEKLQEKEKQLYAQFQASLGDNNKFADYLTKVFKKKIKRAKKKVTDGEGTFASLIAFNLLFIKIQFKMFTFLATSTCMIFPWFYILNMENLTTYFTDFLLSAGSDEDSDEDSDDESDWDEDDEESEEEGGYDLDICPPGCDQVIKVLIESKFLFANTLMQNKCSLYQSQPSIIHFIQ